MALTLEEIKQIADAVAERVVTPQLVCSCGYNALSTALSGERLRLDIDAKNIKGAEEELDNFLRDIADAELACHSKLDEAREGVKKIGKAIKEGDWDEATIQTVTAQNSIEEALHEAATKQSS